jgi:hypothetical protein
VILKITEVTKIIFKTTKSGEGVITHKINNYADCGFFSGGRGVV